MKKTHDDEVIADVHALSAGLKAYITSYTARALNTCRESCGGHGYAAVNRFGGLRNDHDIFQTFEGDNTVLLQQVLSPCPAILFCNDEPKLSCEVLSHISLSQEAGCYHCRWQQIC
jgi:hypothetical protein